MKIYVLSKLQFDSYFEKFNVNDSNIEDKQNLYCISISGISDGEIPYFKTNHTNVLNLQFDDVEHDMYYSKVVTEKNGKTTVKNSNKLMAVAFTENQGKEIIDFISKIVPTDKTVLFIHCTAGISRSGAVGVFCNEYFNLDTIDFKTRNQYIQPNGRVLNVLHNLTIYSHYQTD